MKIRFERTLYMVMGPPGSGKTTYTTTHFPDALQPDQDRYSRAHTPDECLHFDPVLRSLAPRIMQYSLDLMLNRGILCAVSIGGRTHKDRSTITAIANKHCYLTHGILLRVSPETAIQRAKADPMRPATSKSKWKAIVENWYAGFEAIADGEFDAFEEIDNE